MWQDKLKEVIYILENSNMNEIDVTFWGRRFRVVKSAGLNINPDSNPVENYSNNQTNADNSQKSENLKKSTGKEILSPMPGTFYSASSPDSSPFVKEGDKVSKGDSLCIIEAMKIMNEIEAESTGIISEVLIKNGDPVEYNQPLFKIKSS